MAVYYSNRAYTNIKLENYGFAIDDAGEAINRDPNYAKGYYRRASALFALGRYKNALANFKRVLIISWMINLAQVLELVPNDPDATEKYKLVQKIHKEKQLAEAISVESSLQQMTAQSFQEILVSKLNKCVLNKQVPESYTGPKLEEGQEITSEW